MTDTLPLVRQWRLLKLLSKQQLGLTVRELVATLEVSQKTIRRDLRLLQRVGFPVEELVEESGLKKWRVPSRWSETQLNFAFDEALALYLGHRALQPLAGTALWEAGQRAFHKIRASLGGSAQKYLDRMAAVFHVRNFGVIDYAGYEDIFDQVTIGIEERRVVFITYRSQRATEPVTYDIHPYDVIDYRGWLYVVGFAPQHNAKRTWKVNRIEAARADPMHFQRPAEFRVDEYLAGSFGMVHGDGELRVKVRFHPAAARYVRETNWHPSQQLTVQADGSLLAEFVLSGTQEIKSWVYGFGPEAEVLEPKSLRRELAAELEQLRAYYSSSPPSVAARPRPAVTGKGKRRTAQD